MEQGSICVGLRGGTVVLTSPAGWCDIYRDGQKLAVGNWGSVRSEDRAAVLGLLSDPWVRDAYYEHAEIARRTTAEGEAAEQARERAAEAVRRAEMELDWGVVDMDGHLVTHAPLTRTQAQEVADRDQRNFDRSRPDGDKSYLPRSVVRLSAGWRRKHQYSTSWL